MSLNPNATAALYITGLAICRQSSGIWEALFLHPTSSNHKLEVTVLEKFVTGPPDYTKPPRFYRDLTGASINVTAEGAKAPGDPAHKNYNWLDERDMCWLVDMDELHFPGVQLKPTPPFPRSYLSISDSVFYTARSTPNLYDIKEVPNGPVRETRQIGYAIGVDIECNDGGAIVLAVPGEAVRLVKKPGVRYDITFDNSCPSVAGGREDFDYYYDILQNTGKRYTLDKKLSLPAGSIGLLSDEGSCNPVEGGDGSGLSFKDAYNARPSKSRLKKK